MKTLNNNKQQTNDLAEQICLMQRQLQRQKNFLWLLTISLLSMIAIGATSQQDANVIRTKKLQVVNDNGTVLGEFSSNKYGGTLQISNTQGHKVVRLEADYYGGAMHTFHNDGRKGAALRQYPIADIDNKTLTGGMVEVFDHKEESVVVLGSGVDRGVAVSMGAGYNGGAVVVFRNGAPIHFARPKLNAINTLPQDLNGLRFVSIGKYEGGLGPNGMVLGYWFVKFKDGYVSWQHSDFSEGGKYTVAKDGTIKAKIGTKRTIEGFIDRENSRLFWAGKWYRLQNK